MENEEPTIEKGRPQAAVVSLILAIAGIVLPLGALFGFYPFIEHGRAMTDQELVLGLLCSVLFLALEFVALACGLAASGHGVCAARFGQRLRR